MRHLRSIHGPSWRDKVSLVPSQVTPLAPSLNVPAFASKEEISLPVKLNSSLGERSLPDGKADSPTESPDDAVPKATPVTALTAEERFGQLKDKGNSYVKQVTRTMIMMVIIIILIFIIIINLNAVECRFLEPPKEMDIDTKNLEFEHWRRHRVAPF